MTLYERIHGPESNRPAPVIPAAVPMGVQSGPDRARTDGLRVPRWVELQQERVRLFGLVAVKEIA